MTNESYGHHETPPWDVEESRMKFSSAIAGIHGLVQSEAPDWQPGGGAGMDTRQAEMLALFRSFLGPDYDQRKMRNVLALQNSLHIFQERALDDYDHGKISAETYARVVNDAIRMVFEKCDDLLGSEDFERLFGCKLADAGGYIDLNSFLEAEGISPVAR